MSDVTAPPVRTTATHPTRRAAARLAPLVLALTWSIGYLIGGIAWSLGAPGFPFGPSGLEPEPLVEQLPRQVTAPLISVVAGIGALIAAWLLTAASRPGAAPRPVIVPAVYAGAVTLTVTVAVTDTRLMAWTGYALGLQFPPMPAAVLHQLLMVVGAVVWIAAAFAWAGRSRSRVAADGSAPARTLGAGLERPVVAARVAVWIAVVVPLLYAATRLLWLAGIPLDVPADMYREGWESGGWWTGAALGLVAIGGAALTIGLVRPWGEVFPRWIPGLAGRRVPVMLAVVPALTASIIIFSAGLSFIRLVVEGQASMPWSLAAVGPTLLWPVWGAALAAAALAYHHRRTGR
ncbi:hypothetical protein [Agromyces bauzanensis]